MKLFQHSSGIIMSFGFDMVAREANKSLVMWSDHDGRTWDPDTSNAAGSLTWSSAGEVQFVREFGDTLVAFAPGGCLEMRFIGLPLVFAATRLTPDVEEVR
jgi:hypothetical protein